MKTLTTLVLLSSAVLSAQVYERRAAMIPSRGEWGKCTAEVVVDKTAEILIFADRGIIRTINGGQPSTWRRLECSGPMPRNMRDFRLEGRDGRGQVRLVSDPRSNRGTAIIRVDDPRPGSEGYTFDILWRGGTEFGDWERDRPFREWEQYRGGGWIRDGEGPARVEERREERREDRREALIEFRGRGEGSFSSRDGSDRLGSCDVKIAPDGDVRVTFRTRRDSDITLRGRVVKREPGRVIADVSGAGVSGSMILDIERGQVRRVEMIGGRGRERFELRWHE
jgi:hypothetical protein